MSEELKIFFREVQFLRNQPIAWWISIPLSLFLVIVFSYGMLSQIVIGAPWGNKPMSNAMLFVIWFFIIIFCLGLNIIFFITKLIVEIRQEGVYFRLFPFHREFKKLFLDEISGCKIISYNKVKDFSKWIINCMLKKHKLFFTKGKKIVRIEFENGDFIFFGSQEPEGFVSGLETALNIKKNK